MAPTKSTRSAVSKQATAIPAMPTLLPTRKALAKRGTAENLQRDQALDIMQAVRGKRKAESSPVKNEKVKRSALCNLTNNVKMLNVQQLQPAKQDDAQKHIALKKKDINIYNQTQTQLLKDVQNNNTAQSKIMTRAAAAARNALNKPLEQTKSNAINVNANILSTAPVNKQKKDDMPPAAPLVAHAHAPTLKMPNKPARRISHEFNKTDDSLYISALEDVSSCENSRLSGNFETGKRMSLLAEKLKTETAEQLKLKKVEDIKPPPGVVDFDKQSWNDPFQVSHYAMDIFNYLKSREAEFVVDDYMQRQLHLSKWMRSLLVDWMVEVQETFELNHETLYLAVKIVDHYLCRVVIHKDKLQLLGAAALFISCKFDERTPPLVEDFLYICDGAYKHREVIQMEMSVLRTINYDLGIPLSYRFLRRYARCGHVPLPTLTLARYILELSLMDYATVSVSDSRLACAALFIAQRMSGFVTPWNATFEYYTGYKLQDFALYVPLLNACLHRKPKGNIKTILSKYSHKIFHEVAKVPHMSTEKLLEKSLNANDIKELLSNENLIEIQQ